MALDRFDVPATIDRPVRHTANDVDSTRPRRYLEIMPAETAVNPRAAVTAMGQLEALLREHRRTGLLSRLRGRSFDPVVELLLVADGRPDPTIRQLIGSNAPALVDDLEGILRTGLPDGYALTPVGWHPRYVEECLPPTGTADPYVAGVEFCGRARRRRDWQTPLARFEAVADGAANEVDSDHRRTPLARLVDLLAGVSHPVVFQVLARPYRDWTPEAEGYVDDLAGGTTTLGGKARELVAPRGRDGRHRFRPPPTDRARIDGIAAREPHRTLLVSARAVVLTRDGPAPAHAIARRLSTALSSLSGRYHEVVGRVTTDAAPSTGTALYRDLLDRNVRRASYDRLGDRLRCRAHESPGLVVGIEEVAGFCVLDGASLTTSGRRAIATRPTERIGLPLPPADQLARYRPPGMALGMPLTHDRHPYGRPLVLPPAEQDRHVIAVGPTGAGKSVLTETAMVTNLAATEGPAILLDYKGGGTAKEYLQAHYRAVGSLADVTYFDCARVLPALSVLDIRSLLDAGVPREEARSRLAGHYEEILEGVMGAERYRQAVEAPKAIRNHLRALFDPVTGAEAVSHADLHDALRRTLLEDAPPTVSDDALADYFEGLLERDRRVFNRVMGGALNRVETVATDGRLAPMFDHVPGEGDPRFDFADVIDADRVIVIDLGGLETGAKRALTLALLSNLWRALQVRAADPETSDDPPLVNLYLEEAGALADAALLDTLLSQGRSFGLSVFLGVQFLGQLDADDPARHTEEEAINETATILAGRVAVRDDLVDALASDALPPRELNRRLSRLARGEWLVRPAAGFGTEPPRPFLCASLPAPPGHPRGDQPLSGARRQTFDASFDALRKRSRSEHGLDQAERLESGTAEPATDAATAVRPDHCYAHSRRLPAAVDYVPAADAVVCNECRNRYDADVDGLVRAVECHASLEAVDRDDIPIGDLGLKLTAQERAVLPQSAAQLRFLQAVYNAMQERFEPLEYDLTRDSMLRLEEYVDIGTDELEELIEEGLVVHDGDHPHRLYSVTAEGRRVIGEGHREGVDFGHGRGDLEETSSHILGVVLAERYLARVHRDDPDSTVARVQRYHEVDGQRRLDVAGLDDAGGIVVAVEVERINHDLRRAAPADFDKMAACEPKEALWVAMTHAQAREVLDALRDPLDGEPRVTRGYSRTTPSEDFPVDEPGLTQMVTVDQLRSALGLR